MLVLSRKPGEKVVIDGGISVTVIEVNGSRVRVGIDAPDQVRILRGELAEWKDEALERQFQTIIMPDEGFESQRRTCPALA